MNEPKLPDGMKPAVICSNHGIIELTDANYIAQLEAADDLWKCPICGENATFDDESVEPNDCDAGYVQSQKREERRGEVMSKIDDLYGVGGQVYVFIMQARSDYNKRGFIGMAHRAQELLDLIAEHDKEVERIAHKVATECKAEA